MEALKVKTMTPIQRIVCPVDFSEASRRAIDHAIGIAQRYRASLTALHVANPALRSLPEMGTLARDDELTRLHRETAACCARAVTAGLCVEVQIEIGRADTEILGLATARRADLIVMGTHGRGFVGHVMMGSVAERVVRTAPCPVLTVKHPEHDFVT